MVFSVSNFFLWGKPTRLLTVWKIGSHHTTCVTNAMKSGWRVVSKLCFKQRITLLQKELDHVTYKKKFAL
jgi:hypothetical protein